MQLSNFLRTVLKLDAASCLAMAAVLIPAAPVLEVPLGMSRDVLAGAGASLVPIGVFILWLGTRREAPALLAWLVILGNFGWTAASLATALGLPGITALGSVLTAGQGLAVLGLALLEWRGIRESERVAQAA